MSQQNFVFALTQDEFNQLSQIAGEIPAKYQVTDFIRLIQQKRLAEHKQSEEKLKEEKPKKESAKP